MFTANSQQATVGANIRRNGASHAAMGSLRKSEALARRLHFPHALVGALRRQEQALAGGTNVGNKILQRGLAEAFVSTGSVPQVKVPNPGVVRQQLIAATCEVGVHGAATMGI